MIMKTWITKDGRELIISDMEADHIKKVIGLLKRSQDPMAKKYIKVFCRELETRSLRVTREIYLTANESIHVFKVRDKPKYVFNDRGLIYYVFDSVKDLFNYLRRGGTSKLFYEKESDLELYLESL